MMRLANGEIDSVNGTASCQSIKNSSEDLEMYYIAVWKSTRVILYVFFITLYSLHYNYIIIILKGTLQNLQLTILKSTYTLLNSEITVVTYKMLLYITYTYLQYSTYYI